ncbi:hypothetical protein RHSIM_Rhsim03G0167500 [Rhododendron simsii]|uniref:Reverse transcriptase domain-containing protein n=1 Tax=Rhododendron simsii TaxID=118357 RepID=A0A834HCQ9_RHOSS|nr:hypothetical protein RHSIM_Rhsim03G0167500 [Rhododendron simsii]
METKNNKVKLETIRRNLKFDSGTYVEPEGLSGGLALWWNKEVELDVELATKNFMHVIVSDKSVSSCWATTFIYGCPTRAGRALVWEDIRRIARSERLPWLCMGDFNQVLRGEDKMGGVMPSQNQISSFHEMISECGLIDLEFKGPKFTWRNNRSADSLIMERIDMAFANAQWRELNGQAMVFVEAAVGSDHNPLILDTAVPLNRVGKPFRFESFWVTDGECKEVVSTAWSQACEGTVMNRVCKKLRKCKEELKDWSRQKFGNLRIRIATTKEKLLEVQKRLEYGFNTDIMALEKSLIKQLEDLWQKDAMYWHQRSRIKWLQMGDKNSRFFHLSTIQRRQRNQIMRLKDRDGVWRKGNKEIAGLVKLHFKELYQGPPARDFAEVISLVDSVVSTECNANLVKEISREEVKNVVLQMGALKAPGSNGFPGLFYQTYWDTIGDDVFNAIRSFFQDGVMPAEMNQTNVTLIPKVSNPEGMNHLRPISLCRFIYKIISKVLANRLQPYMNEIITEHQSAFIPGRQIQDNIIVAHEVFHFLRNKKVGSKASLAVKLDLNKAYDRVCWDFLFQVMEKMGFEGKWIAWVKQCVCTVKYSIMVNGGQVCEINPKRGLRQGDPLSPYLFLMVADVFSILMKKAVLNKSIGVIPNSLLSSPMASSLALTNLVSYNLLPKSLHATRQAILAPRQAILASRLFCTYEKIHFWAGSNHQWEHNHLSPVGGPNEHWEHNSGGPVRWPKEHWDHNSWGPVRWPKGHWERNPYGPNPWGPNQHWEQSPYGPNPYPTVGA